MREARYIGEFAFLKFNPVHFCSRCAHSFDEKIAGSFHLRLARRTEKS